MKRYFAVIWRDNGGYVLDHYPEESRKYMREMGKSIIGDFATVDEAESAIKAYLSCPVNRRRKRA